MKGRYKIMSDCLEILYFNAVFLSPLMMPFLSSGSAQLTLRDVSKISVKLR